MTSNKPYNRSERVEKQILEIISSIALKNIDLSDDILKEEKGIIEDLIKAAHNNAKSDLKTKTSEEISKTASGFGIPGFKWPL